MSASEGRVSAYSASVYALRQLKTLSADNVEAEVIAVSDHGALLVVLDGEQPMLIAHRDGVSLDEIAAHRFSIIPGAEHEFSRIARELSLH